MTTDEILETDYRTIDGLLLGLSLYNEIKYKTTEETQEKKQVEYIDDIFAF